MTSYDQLRVDCALYNGYKPCRHGNHCHGCAMYAPLPPPDHTDAAGLRDELDALMHPPPVDHDALFAATRAEGRPARILMVKTGAMGDVLRTTTLLAPLGRAYPGHHLTWVTDHAALPLVSSTSLVHEPLPMDNSTAAALVARADREPFDLVLNFEKEPEPLALAGRVAARAKVGYAPTPWNRPAAANAEARDGVMLGLDDHLKFRVNTKSYPEIVCAMAGLPWRRDGYVLGVTARGHARRAAIDAALAAASVGVHPAGGRRFRVALNTGCGAVFRTKQWPLANWTAMARVLRERADIDLLLLGGPAERDLNRAIAAAVPGALDTGVDNPLEEFFGVVDSCDAMITSDTLGMHVAIALGKRVVALFGSTSPVEIDLFDRGAKVITEFACSPCYLRTCDKNPTCMMAMDGGLVAEAVLAQLDVLVAMNLAGLAAAAAIP